MKYAMGLALALLLTGCLSPVELPVTHDWLLVSNQVGVHLMSAPKYGSVRITQVSVASPFDGAKMCVMREHGAVAFDAYNRFASPPAVLLRIMAVSLASESGVFQRVLPTVSTASADLALELMVHELALDARGDGLEASVGVEVLLVNGRGDIMATASAQAKVPVVLEQGFGEPFGEAFSKAFTVALGKL